MKHGRRVARLFEGMKERAGYRDWLRQAGAAPRDGFVAEARPEGAVAEY